MRENILETQLKKRKIHSLTGRITLTLMEESLKAVERNRGAAGIDKVTIELYKRLVCTNLRDLMRKLKDRSYVPKPLRRVYIPKGKGKVRPLGIPTVQCRIAPQVVKLPVSP